MNVFVTGATGVLGSDIYRALTAANINAKAASRSSKSVDGMETVLFDYEKPETYQNAIANIDTVVLIAPSLDPVSDKKMMPFIDVLDKSEVKYVILISALGIDANKEAPLYKMEEYIKTKDLNYVFLRPNFFMENFTRGFLKVSIESQKAMYLAAADGKTSFISTLDISEAAATVIRDFEKYKGKIFNLTGNQAFDHAEVAQLLTKAKNEEIKYIPISAAEMKQGALDMGMPESMADMMLGLYSATSAGYMEPIHDDFTKLTGKQPRKLEEVL